MITASLRDLVESAEDLKADILSFMERNKIEHKGLKRTVNEMLDLLDELEAERKYK